MNAKILTKKKMVLVLIGILLTVIIPQFGTKINYNSCYANEINEDDINENKLTNMQDVFLKLISLKEKNSTLKKDDIKSMISHFKIKEIKKRNSDVITIYSHNDEELFLYTKSLDNSSSIEGIAYKLYNPKETITVLRMHYYDVDKNNKVINLEITSNSIKVIEPLAIQLKANFINTKAYTNYIELMNKVESNNKLTIQEITTINTNFKKDLKSQDNPQVLNHFVLAEDNSNEIVLDTEKNTDKVRALSLISRGKDKNNYDYLNTSTVENLELEDKKYYNISGKEKIIQTLRVYKEDVKELREIFKKSQEKES
ncbi:MAG: hypothetical protein RRZ84_07275 [Romboutsia sp.]